MLFYECAIFSISQLPAADGSNAAMQRGKCALALTCLLPTTTLISANDVDDAQNFVANISNKVDAASAHCRAIVVAAADDAATA